MSSNDDTRNTSTAKRPRTDADAHDAVDRHSVEALLSVPVEIVFRKCSSQEGRPLLTRAEAETFLKISFMAQEIDTLIALAEDILLQQRYCSEYREQLLESNLHPMLRSVIPIISILETQPKSALRDIQGSLCQLLAELRGCATVLRQSSEQNWTLSEALDGLAANNESGQSLSAEKRKVADLEEEIVLRIEKLTAMSNYDVMANMQDENHCRKLFAGEGRSEKTESEQDYALDTQPISEFCSELFQMAFSNPVIAGDGKGTMRKFEDTKMIDEAETNPSKVAIQAKGKCAGQNDSMEDHASESPDQEDKTDQNSALPTPSPDDNGSSMVHQERISSSLKFVPIRTQPDLSGTYSGLSNDDIVEEYDEDDDNGGHSHQVETAACSQRTSTAAEVLAVMASTGM